MLSEQIEPWDYKPLEYSLSSPRFPRHLDVAAAEEFNILRTISIYFYSNLFQFVYFITQRDRIEQKQNDTENVNSYRASVFLSFKLLIGSFLHKISP